MKSIKIFLLSLVALTLFSLSSCNKPAGQGGNSTITGKIWIKRYHNPTGVLVTVAGEYPGAYEDVYIIYGDELSYGDKITANPDGIYVFNYLRPGHYKIYAYSSGLSIPQNRLAVVQEVEITSKKQTVDAGTLEIAK